MWLPRLPQRRSFQSDSLFNCNFPCQYHNNHLNNPNIILNHVEATPIEHIRYTVNDASLLASVKMEQPIIKAAVSSVETFDDNKSKYLEVLKYSLEQYIGFAVRQAFNYYCSLHQVWREAEN